MREVERRGVRIDVCAECKGVWLDRGELDKLLAASREEPYDDDHRSEPPRRERDDYRPGNQGYRPDQQGYKSDHHGHPKRKKRLFEELFEVFD